MQSKADIRVAKIPATHITAAWPLVQPWLVKGLTAATDLSMSDVIRGLRDGTDQLWVALNGKEVIGAFLTGVYESEDAENPKYLAAYALGGERIPEWATQLGDVMADFAKAQGCVAVRFCGRPGWGRLLPTYTVVSERMGHPVYERAI